MGAPLLDPGQLSARLDLYLPDHESDGQGGLLPAHTLVTSVWGRIEPVSATEEERVDEAVFSVTHRVRIRYRNDLARGMLFRKGSRTFTIRAFFDPDETGRYLVCKCSEEGR